MEKNVILINYVLEKYSEAFYCISVDLKVIQKGYMMLKELYVAKK